MKTKIEKRIRGVRKFFLNPHLAICLGIAWLLTNGWAYIFLWCGAHLHIEWMSKISVTYIAILYSPLCVEGVLTIAIAMGLLRLMFPNDDKTIRKLKVLSRYYRLVLKRKLSKHKKKRKTFE